ncbi:hypothetical protein L1049_016670 [Liquidambar formosana]|uniref:Uncharacterized protein n=1 Tax=Liquidambar formosana TaxID=63359 RepID=A0AAP0X386_LIQFO
MKDHQTPQKEQQRRSSEIANRRSKEPSLKSISEQAKRPHKITKKSLNAEFTSVSEDIFSETTKESLGFSPVSEVSDGIQFTESFEASSNPSLSASSESFALSDLTPSSKITTDKDEGEEVSVEHYGLGVSDGMKALEVEVLVDHLRQSRFQVLNSPDLDLRYQKLLDALIQIVIEEFYGLPEERDRFSELLSLKLCIVFLCFSLWMICVWVAFFCGSGGQSSFKEPPPT